MIFEVILRRVKRFFSINNHTLIIQVLKDLLSKSQHWHKIKKGKEKEDKISLKMYKVLNFKAVQS